MIHSFGVGFKALDPSIIDETGAHDLRRDPVKFSNGLPILELEVLISVKDHGVFLDLHDLHELLRGFLCLTENIGGFS